VSILDLSVPPDDSKTRRQLPAVLVKVLCKRLPQLQTLCLDYVSSSISQSVEVAMQVCQTLHTFSWCSPPPNIFFLNGQTFKDAVALKHLMIDDAVLYDPSNVVFNQDGLIVPAGFAGIPNGESILTSLPNRERCAFLRMGHLSLETLSLVNATINHEVHGPPLGAALLPLVSDLWPRLRALRIDARASSTIGDRIRAARPDLTLLHQWEELDKA